MRSTIVNQGQLASIYFVFNRITTIDKFSQFFVGKLIRFDGRTNSGNFIISCILIKFFSDFILKFNKILVTFSLNKSFPSVINAIKTRNKWRHLKIIIRLNHIVSTPKDVDFWPMIYELYSEKYPEIGRLIMLKMIISLTTVQCEKGFQL